MNEIKELRELTGAGMLDCKKALEATNNDIKAAIDYLREKGISKAAKKADRIAAEGLVNIESKDNKSVLLEVNSETDFVASNEEFKELIKNITKSLLENEVSTIEEALEIKYEDGTINDLITSKIAKIGEKLSFRRFSVVTKDSNENFGIYLHNNNKIATLIVLENGNQDVAKDIAMHATAMKPKYIDRSEITSDELDKEREIQKQIAINEGKAPEIAEKMVEGRIVKYYKEVCLNEQQYVKNSDITVEQYAKDNNSKIKVMIRYEVGEGLQKREDNFAEEVMNQIK